MNKKSLKQDVKKTSAIFLPNNSPSHSESVLEHSQDCLRVAEAMQGLFLPNLEKANSTQAILPVFPLKFQFFSLNDPTYAPKNAYNAVFANLNHYISISYNKYISLFFNKFQKIIVSLIANFKGLVALTQHNCRKIGFPRTISNCKPSHFNYWYHKQFHFIIIYIIISLIVSPAFAETASWYGNESICWQWGGKTRNGDTFNENALTCALPTKQGLNRYYKVTNLRNGKSVVVYANDTGSFKKYGRAIDLSKQAFSQIADLKTGIIQVNITEVK